MPRAATVKRSTPFIFYRLHSSSTVAPLSGFHSFSVLVTPHVPYCYKALTSYRDFTVFRFW